MRLWTIHPKYLDAKGLTALWREGLLARKVLSGKTKGYRNHPQLLRFKATGRPMRHIERYLHVVFKESRRRGYRFNRSKLGKLEACRPIRTTRGQLSFEWNHLKRKVRLRDPDHSRTLARIRMPQSNPVFRIVSGPVEIWEKRRRKRIIDLNLRKHAYAKKS